MENTIKRWIRRFGVSFSLAITAVLCVSIVALAVGSITDLRAVYTDTTISLTWTKSDSTDTTVIRYSTSIFPATAADGTSAYSGSGSYTQLTGLTAGTRYYFSAWSYNGTAYSTTAKELLVTTQNTIAGNTTIPYAQPSIPAEAWQNPTGGGWSIHPLDDIAEYFSDPSYAHGGLGMPTANFGMFLIGFMITAMGIFAYIKWHNFFAAYVLVFVASFFAVAIHMMQGYVIGLEILIGMGVWAVEHNFQ